MTIPEMSNEELMKNFADILFQLEHYKKLKWEFEKEIQARRMGGNKDGREQSN